jgi:hypothetical protein
VKGTCILRDFNWLGHPRKGRLSKSKKFCNVTSPLLRAIQPKCTQIPESQSAQTVTQVETTIATHRVLPESYFHCPEVLSKVPRAAMKTLYRNILHPLLKEGITLGLILSLQSNKNIQYT